MAADRICDWCEQPIGDDDSQARERHKPGWICGKCLAAFRTTGREVLLRAPETEEGA